VGLCMCKICLYGGTVSKSLSRGDKMKSNIAFRNLTDKYGTYSEQDLSHIFVPVSALPSPHA